MSARLSLGLAIGVAGAAAACGPDPTPTTEIRCWGQEIVDYSSQTSATDYSAERALGPADTQDWTDDDAACVSSPDAWSPAERDAGAEHITLRYGGAISVNRVDAFDNYGPGVVQMVTLSDSQDDSVEPLKFAVPGSDQGPGQPCGEPLEVDIDLADGFEFTRETFDTVRLDLDTSNVSGWNEIDAVALLGQVRGENASGAPEGCEAYSDPPPEE